MYPSNHPPQYPVHEPWYIQRLPPVPSVPGARSIAFVSYCCVQLQPARVIGLWSQVYDLPSPAAFIIQTSVSHFLLTSSISEVFTLSLEVFCRPSLPPSTRVPHQSNYHGNPLTSPHKSTTSFDSFSRALKFLFDYVTVLTGSKCILESALDHWFV